MSTTSMMTTDTVSTADESSNHNKDLECNEEVEEMKQERVEEQNKCLQMKIFSMKQDLESLRTQMVESQKVARQREHVLNSEITRLIQIHEELTTENDELVTEIQDVMYELERSYKELSEMTNENKRLKRDLRKMTNERDDIAEKLSDEIQHDTLSIKEQLQQVRNEERAKVAVVAAEGKLAEKYLELQKLENDQLRSHVEYLQGLLKDTQSKDFRSSPVGITPFPVMES